VKVIDTLDPNVTFVPGSVQVIDSQGVVTTPTNFTYNSTTRQLTGDLGYLLQQEQVTIKFNVTVNQNAPTAGTADLNNTVQVLSINDSNTANNTNTEATDVLAPVNRPPVAVNDTLAGTEDTALTITSANLFGADGTGPVNDSDVDSANFSSIKVTTLATNGTLFLAGTAVSLNQVITAADIAANKLTFSPNANFNGAASFDYTVSDGALVSNEATVTINVAAVNDAPIAVDDTLTGTEDTALTITSANLFGADGTGPLNDSDVDSANFSSIKVTTLATNGTLFLAGVAVSLNQVITAADIAANKLTFSPNANFNGAASFDYTVSDGTLVSNEATVTINVAAVNDAPIAVDDTLTGTEDTALIITSANLFGADGTGPLNDSDVDSANFSSIKVTTLATNGTLFLAGVAVSLNQVITAADIAANKLTFSPNANFNGAASFDYTVSDGTLVSNEATVTINVAAVNDAPIAVDDTLTGTEDTALIITSANLFGGDGTGPLNDSDVDSANFSSIKVTTLATNGTLFLAGTAVSLNQVITAADIAANKLTFSPNANFNGAASFDYTVSDGALVSNEATVTINVAAVNDAPIAVDDTLTGTEDTALTITSANLFGADGTGPVNDSDVDSANFSSIKVTTLATNGTLFLAGTAVSLNQVITAADIAANKLTFSPNANFNGAASFDYTVSDGALVSNEATVTINVAAVNDAPIAVDDTLTGTEDTALIITSANLFGGDGTGPVNDSDVDSANFSSIKVTTLATNGTLFLAGVAVSLNQVITAADIAANKLTFSPNANFNGAASFDYTVSDGTLVSNEATVTINVAAVNDAPIAVDDTLTGTEDTALIITSANLFGADGTGPLNDSDVDSANFSSIKVTTLATNGTLFLAGVAVSLNQVITAADIAANKLTFSPNANFNGAASFDYTVSDGTLVSNEATVTINVAAVNDAPIAVDDTLTGTEDTALIITSANLFGADGTGPVNDSDVDSANFSSIKVTTLATNGTLFLAGVAVSLNQVITAADIAANKLTFSPNANFNGAASFDYTVSDGTLVSNEATVTINVAAVNDAPIAVDDTLTGTEDTALIITSANLFGGDGTGPLNDSDVDSANFSSIKVTTLATNGTLFLAGVAVSLNQVITAADIAANKLTFSPNANFNGAASFDYTVSDGTLVSNVATVTINLAAVNDPPVDGNESVTTLENSPISGNVLNNASDVDGDTLSVTTFTLAGNNTTYTAGQTATITNVGTLLINGNGTYTFTPVLNYDGAVPVATYTVSDGKGGTDASTLTIGITPVTFDVGQIAPTGVTPNQYINGTAPDFSQFYASQGGVISTAPAKVKSTKRTQVSSSTTRDFPIRLRESM
jgi:osmotically-inducible protein OsmY